MQERKPIAIHTAITKDIYVVIYILNQSVNGKNR